MIIDGETIKVENVIEIMMKLQANQINQRVLLVIRDDSPIYRSAADVTHRWNQLSRGAKEEASKRTVTFQGKLISLKDLCLSVEVLDKMSLRNLFEGKIVIGPDLKFGEIKFFLRRNFFIPAGHINQKRF